MRKTLLITAALLSGLTLSGCRGSATPAEVPASAYTESAPPSVSVTPTIVDFRKDITDLTATAADAEAFPGGHTAMVRFVITNHGDVPAFYSVTLAVYDKTGAQTGGILIDTEASGMGTVKPGGRMVIDGPYAAENWLPVPFTVQVETVDRRPAGV